MQVKPLLILDLDGTLLHTENLPAAIEIPGRTRPSFLASQTIDLLARLSETLDLVIATARSRHGTKPIVKALEAAGAPVLGSLVEDGCAWLASDGSLLPTEPWRDWEKIRKDLDPLIEALGLTWQLDFEHCLVARARDRAHAQDAIPSLIAFSHSQNLRIFNDGRKIYLVGEKVDKWSALQHWLGDRLEGAYGIGDGENDLCWLRHVAHPMSFAHATPAVLEMMSGREGYISRHSSHEGISEILEIIREMIDTAYIIQPSALERSTAGGSAPYLGSSD